MARLLFLFSSAQLFEENPSTNQKKLMQNRAPLIVLSAISLSIPLISAFDRDLQVIRFKETIFELYSSP